MSIVQNTYLIAVYCTEYIINHCLLLPGEDDNEPRKFRVEGGTVFNSVVRMCVLNLQPGLKKFLKQV